ncbi:hypothetical protein FB45DRAFT_1068549 [Roridomyces roridus]|uniref:Pheromone n=1 Tax=Roridomyces roridus TaxID=1738132 RepID=A0AAD7B033_9AGAR|nr:hypothetical protein FB45DRAFT_1068549 [Roridomyces roridus]
MDSFTPFDLPMAAAGVASMDDNTSSAPTSSVPVDSEAYQSGNPDAFCVIA